MIKLTSFTFFVENKFEISYKDKINNNTEMEGVIQSSFYYRNDGMHGTCEC